MTMLFLVLLADRERGIQDVMWCLNDQGLNQNVPGLSSSRCIRYCPPRFDTHDMRVIRYYSLGSGDVWGFEKYMAQRLGFVHRHRSGHGKWLRLRNFIASRFATEMPPWVGLGWRCEESNQWRRLTGNGKLEWGDRFWHAARAATSSLSLGW